MPGKRGCSCRQIEDRRRHVDEETASALIGIGAHGFANGPQFFDRSMKSRKATITPCKTRSCGEAVRDFGKQNREIPDASNAIDWITSGADAELSAGQEIQGRFRRIEQTEQTGRPGSRKKGMGEMS